MIDKIFNILNIAQISKINKEERFIFHKKILNSKKNKNLTLHSHL